MGHLPWGCPLASQSLSDLSDLETITVFILPPTYSPNQMSQLQSKFYKGPMTPDSGKWSIPWISSHGSIFLGARCQRESLPHSARCDFWSLIIRQDALSFSWIFILCGKFQKQDDLRITGTILCGWQMFHLEPVGCWLCSSFKGSSGHLFFIFGGQGLCC